MLDIFEKATKTRLRYVTDQGTLATEDIWRLSLEKLDDLAIGLRREVESSAGESFIEEDSQPNPETELAFEVVKHIINVKLAERKEFLERKDRAAKKAKLLELIAKKQDANLEGLSIAELTKQFEALG